MRDHAINHHKIIGNWENRQAKKNFQHYQGVQKQLLSTASHIGKNGPQHPHILTGLFVWGAIVAPNLTPVLPGRVASVSSSPQFISLISNNATVANSSLVQEHQELHSTVRSAFSVSGIVDSITLPAHTVSSASHRMPIARSDVSVPERSRHRRAVDTFLESTSGIPIEPQEMTRNEPAQSVHVDTVPSCLEGRQDRMPDLNDANQYVLELLEKNGDAPTGCERSAHAIVRSAIVFAERDMTSHAALASAIQKARGHYGGNVAEVLLFPVQKLMIRDWVTRTILGGDIAILLESLILVTERPAHLTSRHLAKLLMNELPESASDSFILQEWLVKNVILEQLPILRQFFISDGLQDPGWQRISTMKLHDFEFGMINAGLRFAHSLELDHGSLSVESALQWGQILLTQLQEGVVPPQWWSFFQLPATIRYTQNNPDLMKGLSGKEKQEMRVHALSDYHAAYEEFITRHNPVAKFNQLMAGYTTRTQFARQIAAHSLSNIPGSGSVHGSQLPDADKIFQAHVDEIADSYKVVNELLLVTAWSKLPDEEVCFVNGAKVSRAWAEFSAADELNFVPVVGGNRHARQGLQVALVADVELFSAQHPGQKERIYALQHTPSGYAIKRVDRDSKNYFSYLDQDQRPATDSSFKLKVHVNAALKSQEQELGILVAQIAQKHRDDFAQKLYQYGFNPTTQETIRDVMLSLIPFYTCLTSTDEQQAALSCTLDALSLFPVIGELSELSVRLAEVFSTASLIAARGAAIEMARRGMLQEAIRVAGSEFVRYSSPRLETIIREGVETLLVASLRAVDPGVELIGSISGAAVRQAIRLGKMMTSRPGLYARMEVAAEKLSVSMNHAILHYGKLPGMKDRVPVIRLDGDRFHGKDIYVRIYPDTGIVFGRKYIMWPDGSLEAIPVGMARRLQNILEQGLSGRGAVRKASGWGVARTEISATLLQQIQQGIADGDSLASLANHHEVGARRLERYISPSGALTARGRELIDAASAGPSRDAVPIPPYGIMQLAQSVLSIHAGTVDRSVNRLTNPLHHSAPVISADEHVRSVFLSDGQKIQTKDKTYFTYDIDLDVFRMDESEESSFVYIANPTKKNKMVALTMEQAIKRKKSISLDQRTAVVKALGIELDFAEVLAITPTGTEAQTLLPKVIRYVWVGDRAISAQILENLHESAMIANNHGYQVRVYLSEKSRELNLARLKEAICDLDNCLPLSRNKVHILEEIDFYKEFKQSENFAQYQDAIDGNGGIATNFASAADILRYALVEKKGGLYMDMDDDLLDGLGDVELKTKDQGLVFSSLLSAEDFGMRHQLGTSFFGAHKGNVVLKAILQEIHHRYQQEKYRNFYKIPRPDAGDRSANERYITTLFSLTGPGVFNDVIREQMPDIRRFIELSKLSKLGHHAYASELFRQLSEKIPDAKQITPLAKAHIIGNLHSWQHYR
jgi:hypothetical protein